VLFVTRLQLRQTHKPASKYPILNAGRLPFDNCHKGMDSRMAKKKTPKNIYGTDQEWADIDDARDAAGHTTLTGYLIESALSKEVLILTDVAHQLGRLGMICNEVLIADTAGHETARLQGEDAEVALNRIIETCDAVTKKLNRA